MGPRQLHALVGGGGLAAGELDAPRPSSMTMAAQPPGPGLPRAGAVRVDDDGEGLSGHGTLPLTAALSPRGGEGDQGEPVEVAAAGLAGDQRALRAQLLEALGRDRHAAAAAEVRLGHLARGRGRRAPCRMLVVVGEDGGGSWPRQLGALGADHGQLGLDAAELLLRAWPPRCLPSALARLEARLGVLDVGGEPLLGLHEDEDLLLDPGLLLLDLLDLDEDRGVFLVGLDLVEPAFVLAALGLDDLEVLFLARAGLLRAASSRALAGSTVLLAPPRPRRGWRRSPSGSRAASASRAAMRESTPADRSVSGAARPLISPHCVTIRVPLAHLRLASPSHELVGPLGLEPRPNRL